MTTTEHLLTILAEECNEVAHRCSKALRFGLSEIQKGQDLTNRDRIQLELCDLLAVVQMLREKLVLNDLSQIVMDVKKNNVQVHLKYSKELGTLKD
jgi:hypothetical protein